MYHFRGIPSPVVSLHLYPFTCIPSLVSLHLYPFTCIPSLVSLHLYPFTCIPSLLYPFTCIPSLVNFKKIYMRSPILRGWLHSRRREWVSQAIEKYSSQCQQVKYLEIGLGCVYTKIISKKGIVTAIDINEDFVERASRLENVSARVADIQSTSFEPIYDVALCSEVIEHLSDSEITIKHIYLSLKPGVIIFILTTPNKYSTVELAARILTILYLRRFIQKLYKEPVDDLGAYKSINSAKAKRTNLQRKV